MPSKLSHALIRFVWIAEQLASLAIYKTHAANPWPACCLLYSEVPSVSRCSPRIIVLVDPRGLRHRSTGWSRRDAKLDQVGLGVLLRRSRLRGWRSR
jgi:hypothetical protein